MPNWNRLWRPYTLLVLLATWSVTVPGCTLAGAGAGAGVDSLLPGPYQERPAAELTRLQRDGRVVVALRNGTRVTGRYRGTHGPTAADFEHYLLVSADEKLVSIKASDVSSIAVEVTGKGWLYGGLIGLVADTVIVTAAVVALNNMELDLSNDHNGQRY